MEGYSRKEEKCNKVFDMVPKGTSHGVCEEKKLELRLGPPDGDWCVKDRERDDSHLSFTYFSKRGFLDPVNNGGQPHHHHQFSSFLRLQSPSHLGCSKAVDLNSSEKMAFAQPAAKTSAALPSTSQKRSAPSPVVGWPPLRSFRKNLACSSSGKQNPESPNKFSSENPIESSKKGFFVKINMDGIPIGRKVDLSAFDSYEKLAASVSDLFKGLLAAQNEGGNQNKKGEKAITGLLDGSGEYTLVYEDNEGDTMLVGDDVHWQMFVSTVKRLRVLKTSEISTLSRGKQVKL